MPFFFSDSGRWAVAGEDDCVIGQRKQFLMNCLSQYFKTTVGKIGSANAAREQHVAAEDLNRAQFVGHKHDMPRAMARSVPYFQLKTGIFESLAFARLGITPDDLEAIFNIFISRKGGRGTGLGLPVSRKIMEEHGGQILVDSQPGEGSTFTLELSTTPQQVEGDPSQPASQSLTSFDVQLDEQPDLSSHS